MDTREHEPVNTGADTNRPPAWRPARVRQAQRRARAARAASGPRQARGSIAIVAALALAIAVTALGVLDIANVYLARRSLQNVADLAALAAVQQMDDQCQQPPVTALASAANNGFTVSSTQTLSTVCGRWDSSGSGMAFTQASSPPAATQLPLNGVIVTVSKLVPYFFLGPARPLQATSTAKATVVGSFSLATSLVQVNLLNGLLSSLLGTSVNLSLVSWNGIANANVTLGQLAAVATSAGTVTGLLNSSVSVSGLAQLMINALQSGGSVVSADAAASIAGLQAIVSAGALSNVQIPLGATSSSPGLLSVGLANAESAANVSLNALQALLVAAEIAQSGKSPLAVNLSLANLPTSSLLPASVQLAVNVLSPPSIAVGEAGANPDPPPQWRTYAHNAQITVALNVGLADIGVKGVLDASVNIPLFVEAAPATAGLASASCGPTAAQSSSTINVQTGIANLCLGSPPATAQQLSTGTCGGSPADIASVNVFGQNAVTIASSLALNLATGTNYQLSFDGNGNLLGNSQTGSSGSSVNTNQVGDVLGGALTSLSTQLGNNQSLSTGNPVLSIQVGSLPPSNGLGWFAGAIAGLLSPVLSALDTVLLGPLLQLLGVQLGVASVTDFPLSCGVAQLVK
jgi:uncharacterized membrane protein